jgi:hypothetical protein
MPLLSRKTVFFIERYLLAQATCANGVGSVIEQHVTSSGSNYAVARVVLRIATAARSIFQS